MRVYLRSGYRASIHGFRSGDWSLSERIDAENIIKMNALFNMLVSGKIDYFYHRQKHLMEVYHRSSRGALVQKSVFMTGTADGNKFSESEWIPLSHEEYRNEAEFLKSCSSWDSGYYNVKIA